jgi:hypothetical protein
LENEIVGCGRFSDRTLFVYPVVANPHVLCVVKQSPSMPWWRLLRLSTERLAATEMAHMLEGYILSAFSQRFLLFLVFAQPASLNKLRIAIMI